MFNKKVALFLLVLTLLPVLVFAAEPVATNTAASVPVGTPGSKAVDFNLKDLAGRNVDLLKDYAGKKAVIVVFGTTWCHYCLAEIPNLKAVYEKYKDKGVAIVQVDPQEPKERVQGMVNKYKIPYTVLLDEDGAIARQYRIMGVPTILFLDHNQVIKWRSSGGEQDYNGRLMELGIK
jgi:peroxiredoxin